MNQDPVDRLLTVFNSFEFQTAAIVSSLITGLAVIWLAFCVSMAARVASEVWP